jgi:DNA repair protein RadD
MTPRYYQQEAVDAVNAYLKKDGGNPCVELPTGSGKSMVAAMLIHVWIERFPAIRVVVLAHRKELVEQNYGELHGIDPTLDLGIYSAGLGRKDTDRRILYASIDSIVNRPSSILVPHVVIIDEAHMIPAKGEGKYRKLIANFKARNPKLRVVGLTATPYRMDCGPICHRDHILTDLVYSANVGKLIDEGFLCKLRSRVKESPDVSKVRRNSGGDFVTESLSEAVDAPEVVEKAVRDAVSIIEAEDRKSVMFFCVSEEHCRHVSSTLAKYGIHAPVVTAKTKPTERDAVVANFKAGRLRAICNIDVYTTGFNAKQVDCIVMLRPTLSRGLYAQIVGRGLRIHPAKQDCLILDYGGNILRHGPIDCIEAGEVRLHECDGCGDSFSFALGKCPGCGSEIPKKTREAVEAQERERQLHDAKRAEVEILGKQAINRPVDGVSVHRHVKAGSPDSLRVEYRCGLEVFREWVCLDHPGYPGEKALKWWQARFDVPKPSVEDALDGMFGGFSLGKRLQDVTISITTKKTDKFDEIIWHQLKQKGS